jgi:nitrite reductase/ring-hydroxylating ferredoxin subunit
VDQTVFDPGPEDWTPVGTSGDDLAEQGAPHRAGRRHAGDARAQRGRVHALHDRCSHRGCSLAGGDVEADAIVCNCHGSRFALEDGRVLRGPATTPQPAYEVRDGTGGLEIRLRG